MRENRAPVYPGSKPVAHELSMHPEQYLDEGYTCKETWFVVGAESRDSSYKLIVDGSGVALSDLIRYQVSFVERCICHSWLTSPLPCYSLELHLPTTPQENPPSLPLSLPLAFLIATNHSKPTTLLEFSPLTRQQVEVIIPRLNILDSPSSYKTLPIHPSSTEKDRYQVEVGSDAFRPVEWGILLGKKDGIVKVPHQM